MASKFSRMSSYDLGKRPMTGGSDRHLKPIQSNATVRKSSFTLRQGFHGSSGVEAGAGRVGALASPRNAAFGWARNLPKTVTDC